MWKVASVVLAVILTVFFGGIAILLLTAWPALILPCAVAVGVLAAGGYIRRWANK